MQNQDDRFHQELQEHKQSMQDCQNQKQLSSCLTCSQILDCPTRTNYVKQVYLFLNKGQSDSDFDF